MSDSTRRRRLGAVLIALGVLTILGSVLWMLEVMNGPGTGPKTFAERRSYDIVKESAHEVFPRGFAVGLVGLGLALAGGRMRRASPDTGEAG